MASNLLTLKALLVAACSPLAARTSPQRADSQSFAYHNLSFCHFKRTNKVTESFVVLSEVSDEVCDWDSEWGSERISGP